jgi:hypothetical protein
MNRTVSLVFTLPSRNPERSVHCCLVSCRPEVTIDAAQSALQPEFVVPPPPEPIHSPIATVGDQVDRFDRTIRPLT